MNYTLIIQKAKEGGYIGFIPEIPGVNTQGETEIEVRENIKDALQMVVQYRKDEALGNIKDESDYTVDTLDL